MGAAAGERPMLLLVGQMVTFVLNGRPAIGTVEALDKSGTRLTVRTPSGERHALFLWRVRAA